MRAGGLQLLDGFYSTLIDSGLEFYVKTSHLLSLSEDDLLPILGE